MASGDQVDDTVQGLVEELLQRRTKLDNSAEHDYDSYMLLAIGHELLRRRRNPERALNAALKAELDKAATATKALRSDGQDGCVGLSNASEADLTRCTDLLLGLARTRVGANRAAVNDIMLGLAQELLRRRGANSGGGLIVAADSPSGKTPLPRPASTPASAQSATDMAGQPTSAVRAPDRAPDPVSWAEATPVMLLVCAAGAYDGLYELVPGKNATGFPIWRHHGCDHWIFRSPSNHWMIGEDEQRSRGFLCHTGIFAAVGIAKWPHDVPAAGWAAFDPHENRFYDHTSMYISRVPEVIALNRSTSCSGAYELTLGPNPTGSPIWLCRDRVMWIYRNPFRQWMVGGEAEFNERFMYRTGHLGAVFAADVDVWPHVIPSDMWLRFNGVTRGWASIEPIFTNLGPAEVFGHENVWHLPRFEEGMVACKVNRARANDLLSQAGPKISGRQSSPAFFGGRVPDFGKSPEAETPGPLLDEPAIPEGCPTTLDDDELGRFKMRAAKAAHLLRAAKHRALTEIIAQGDPSDKAYADSLRKTLPREDFAQMSIEAFSEWALQYGLPRTVFKALFDVDAIKNVKDELDPKSALLDVIAARFPKTDSLEKRYLEEGEMTSVMEKVRSVRMDELVAIAKAAGVDASVVDEALCSSSPGDSITELVLVKYQEKGNKEVVEFVLAQRAGAGSSCIGLVIVPFEDVEKAEGLAQQLRDRGVIAWHCHLGMSPEDRERLRRAWRSGVVHVVVAANGSFPTEDPAKIDGVHFVVRRRADGSVEYLKQREADWQKGFERTRAVLTLKLFMCVSGGNAMLNERMLRKFADLCGFEGSREEWREEYLMACALFRWRPEAPNIDVARFSIFVDDERSFGYLTAQEMEYIVETERIKASKSMDTGTAADSQWIRPGTNWWSSAPQVGDAPALSEARKVEKLDLERSKPVDLEPADREPEEIGPAERKPEELGPVERMPQELESAELQTWQLRQEQSEPQEREPDQLETENLAGARLQRRAQI